MLSQDEFDLIFRDLAPVNYDPEFDFIFRDLAAVNYDPVRVFHGPMKRPYRFLWRQMARKLFQKHIGL